MKKPVWYSEAKGTARDAFVRFSAGRDLQPLPGADEYLVPYDIWTNQAYAIGLHHIEVFSTEELEEILRALLRLDKEVSQGDWQPAPNLEDIHINIESYVSSICGEALGGKLHTGRSRNDQVATDMKLYLRDCILQFLQEINLLCTALINHARNYMNTVMPGYTHHRKATLTTWGHWCASYCQALMRDADRFQKLYTRMNFCPLGSGAAYGTTWSINRRLIAELLAFPKIQENTLDAVRSRGESEAELAYVLAMFLKKLSGISQDLILFSTDEFGYLSLPHDFTTGSSIMPQKRNPDFAEAIKGKAEVVMGYASALMSIDGPNLSGYNKDSQWSKYLITDAIRETSETAVILSEVFNGLKVHGDVMEKATHTGFLNAVDIADHLARTRHLPFRKTYGIISDAVGLANQHYFVLEDMNKILEKHGIESFTEKEFASLQNPSTCVSNRNHVGSPRPSQVKRHLVSIGRQNDSIRKWLDKEKEQIRLAKERCSSI